MKINEFAREVHELAKEKGWYQVPRSALEVHALIHSEISEATEEVRKDSPSVYVERYIIQNGETFRDPVLLDDPRFNYLAVQFKPEGEAVELADAVLRIMDYFGSMGWDLETVLRVKHEYNKTRPYRHGKKL